MFPQGGTELQHRLLDHYVDEKLLSNFQICTSIPNKVPLSNDKINILWQKNSYDQPNIYPWFEDKNMNGMFLTASGIMKSYVIVLIYLLINVM